MTSKTENCVINRSVVPHLLHTWSTYNLVVTVTVENLGRLCTFPFQQLKTENVKGACWTVPIVTS
jgi:hypothetical protein